MDRLHLPVRRRETATLAQAALLLAAAGIAQAAVEPARLAGPGTVYTVPGCLELGPVAGLTTAWQRAPEELVLPGVAQLDLRLDPGCLEDPVLAKSLLGHEGTVVSARWEGATVTHVDTATGPSEAVARLAAPERHEIRVRLETHYPDLDVTVVHEDATTVRTLDVPLADVRVEGVDAAVTPLALDPTLPREELNARSLELFFGESVAALRRVAADHWRTSVERTITFAATAWPPGVESVLEWRVDGEPVPGLGATLERFWTTSGRHTVRVGPEHASRRLLVDTYAVRLDEAPERIADGEPHTFTAVTEPPGFADEVTWLAATKVGRAEPPTGVGWSFTVRFTDTRGSDGWQWVGVVGDHAAFEQDVKCDDCADGFIETCEDTPGCHDCCDGEGACPCVQGIDCTTATPCPGGVGDCPAGWSCCVGTCCGEAPVCVPPCGTLPLVQSVGPTTGGIRP